VISAGEMPRLCGPALRYIVMSGSTGVLPQNWTRLLKYYWTSDTVLLPAEFCLRREKQCTAARGVSASPASMLM